MFEHPYKRVTLLRVSTSTGDQRIGTGYLVNDRLCLTARHVWYGNDASSSVPVQGQIKTLVGGADWMPVSLAWANDPTIDACLLQVESPVEDVGSEPRLGFYDRSRSVQWESGGFPRAAIVDTGLSDLREVVGASGKLHAVGGVRQDLLDLGVEHAPEDERDWQGMSGAPVFADGCLIALVSQTFFRGKRFRATAIERVFEDPGVRGLLGVRTLHQVPRGALLLPEGDAHLPKDSPPSLLIHPRQRVVEFDESLRRREFETIAKWLESPPLRSLLLVTAPGGAGKTRLLSHACELQRRRRWHAGFMPLVLDEGTLQQLLDDERPTLVCIDYAEMRPNLVAEMDGLLSAQRDAPLRIVLLARGIADWWPQLLEREKVRGCLIRSNCSRCRR